MSSEDSVHKESIVKAKVKPDPVIKDQVDDTHDVDLPDCTGTSCGKNQCPDWVPEQWVEGLQYPAGPKGVHKDGENLSSGNRSKRSSSSTIGSKWSFNTRESTPSNSPRSSLDLCRSPLSSSLRGRGSGSGSARLFSTSNPSSPRASGLRRSSPHSSENRTLDDPNPLRLTFPRPAPARAQRVYEWESEVGYLEFVVTMRERERQRQGKQRVGLRGVSEAWAREVEGKEGKAGFETGHMSPLAKTAREEM